MIDDNNGIKDTQPYQVVPDDSEQDKPKKKSKSLVGEILKNTKDKKADEVMMKSNSFKDRQVEMTGEGFNKAKKQRLAVWTQNGSRKWNTLRHKLHQIVIEAKKEGDSDEQAFCRFADNKEVQRLFSIHQNESVRDWKRDQIIESAKTRMRQDMEKMLADDSIPANTADELPDFLPKALLSGKKRSYLQEYFTRAGGNL